MDYGGCSEKWHIGMVFLMWCCFGRDCGGDSDFGIHGGACDGGDGYVNDVVVIVVLIVIMVLRDNGGSDQIVIVMVWDRVVIVLRARERGQGCGDGCWWWLFLMVMQARERSDGCFDGANTDWCWCGNRWWKQVEVTWTCDN